MKRKLATCPHCGVPIYYSRKGDDGLPIPEYACDCRYRSVAIWPQVWPTTGTGTVPNYPWTPIYGEGNQNPPMIGDPVIVPGPTFGDSGTARRYPWRGSDTFCDATNTHELTNANIEPVMNELARRLENYGAFMVIP